MDLAEIDENGKGLQFFGKTKVERLEKMKVSQMFIFYKRR